MKVGLRNLIVSVVMLAPVLAGGPRLAVAADNVAQRALLERTAGKAIIDRNAQGRIAHLRATNAPLAVDSSLSPDARARKVLAQYRDAFIDRAVPLELTTTRAIASGSAGRSFVRYQQRINGVAVRGAEVIVHLDKRGVTAVHSRLVSDLDSVATVPGILPDHAVESARTAIGKLFPRASLGVAPPRLEVINVALMRGAAAGKSRLAWFTEVSGRGVHENVWVDATTGEVLLHFSQIAHAFAVSDYADSCLDPAPANPAYYDELTAAPLGSDAEAALANMAAAHAYYNNELGQSGFDDTNTVTQAAIVRVCAGEPELAGVAEKAEWHLGQMVFATGIALADDIVGHEYSHGVVQYTAQLNLLGQSGALAEGFADALGEAIDLLQRTDNDSGDTRWAFGEDATGGPFRNLSAPGDNGLPGKVSDSDFYCGTDDSAGIHKNGTVIAHAFALLADGGSYNGFTITGIGMQKAARIFYDTVIGRLTASSSFLDAFFGFKAAADALVVDGVISSSDRAQLTKVLDAVELASEPCSSKLNYCPTGQTPVILFSDGFESTTSGLWSNSVSTGVNHWTDFGAVGAIAVDLLPG
jgi:Zn-dependent metalloprotease